VGTTQDNLKKMSAINRANWKCSECRKRDPRSVSSESSPDRLNSGSVESSMTSPAIQEMQKRITEGVTSFLRSFITKEFTKMKGEFATAFEDLKDSLNFLSTEYEDLKNRIAALEKAMKRQEEREVGIDQMRGRIGNMEREVETSRQESLRMNIEIFGVHKKSGENLQLFIKKAAESVSFELKEHDVDAIYRSADRPDGRPSNIVLRMTSAASRDRFLTLLKNRDRTRCEGTDKVYFNEHLTFKNKLLYKNTRERARELNFRFVWIKNGNIYAREKADSKVYRVRCNEDVQLLTSANGRGGDRAQRRTDAGGHMGEERSTKQV
jgi:hypothetical protein